MENVRYRDLSINFAANPLTGDLSVVSNENAVKQSVVSIIKTEVGERYFSDLGSKLGNLLFENFNPILREEIRESISYSLAKHEPRSIVSDIKVNVDEDRNSLSCTITFVTNNADEPENVTVTLRKVK